jgi:hypothetical protein
MRHSLAGALPGKSKISQGSVFRQPIGSFSTDSWLKSNGTSPRPCKRCASKKRSLPSLPLYHHQTRLLVRESNLLLLVKSHILQVLYKPSKISILPRAHLFYDSNLLVIIQPRLAQHPLGPRIRQKTIMHQRTHPNMRSLFAPEFLFPHESMETTIPIPYFRRSHILAQPVFFDPVYLKIPKRLAVPASYRWKTVFLHQR